MRGGWDCPWPTSGKEGDKTHVSGEEGGRRAVLCKLRGCETTDGAAGGGSSARPKRYILRKGMQVLSTTQSILCEVGLHVRCELARYCIP